MRTPGSTKDWSRPTSATRILPSTRGWRTSHCSPSQETEPLEEDTLSPEEFDRLDSEPLPAAEVEPAADEAMQPRRSNAIIFVGYMILALAALGVVTYLVFRLMEGPPAPPLRAGLLERLSSAWVLLGVPVVRRRRKG